MTPASTTTYALLALLGVQPWTSYELTQQVRRSLRFAWPRSEANLYSEQKRLVRLGWARAEEEQVGRRRRARYHITPAGRRALKKWLTTEPAAPRFEIEGLVRLMFAEHGTADDLRRSLEATAAHARVALDDGLAQARDYLETGGPFPDRLHLIALAGGWIADSLALLERFCTDAAATVAGWDGVAGPPDPEESRRVIAGVLARHGGGAPALLRRVSPPTGATGRCG